MPTNLEEKKKCMEKLNQMEKFLPFLDFMIEKIKKKSSEITLACQLSKFQNLKSMITEKNNKHSWDALIKVEDVIQKLIVKLDYKDELSISDESVGYMDSSKDIQPLLRVSPSVENMSNTAASVSIIPSSTTTTISVAQATSLSYITTVDSRPEGTHANTIDLIENRTKVSEDSPRQINTNNERVNEFLMNPLSSTVQCKKVSNLEENEFLEKLDKGHAWEKIIETNLDKDLDGVELTDDPSVFESDCQKRAVETVIEGSEAVSHHLDLLSSSREKLLKSLQKKLNPPRGDCASLQSSTEKLVQSISDSQSISACSYVSDFKTHVGGRTHNEFLETGSSSDISPSISIDKQSNNLNAVEKTMSHSSPKYFFADSSTNEDKGLSDLVSNTWDSNSKQKLREKLSADICEVYKVPGRSVGGSLRSLKDIKDNKKTSEDELVKLDRVNAVCHSSGSATFGDNREGSKNKYEESHLISLKNKTYDACKDLKNFIKKFKLQNKDCWLGEEKPDRSHFFEFDRSELQNHRRLSLDQKSEETHHTSECVEFTEKKDTSSDLSGVDDESLEFVKENVNSLPHLPKLKLSDFSKVHSYLTSPAATSKADAHGQLNDDSNEPSVDKYQIKNCPYSQESIKYQNLKTVPDLLTVKDLAEPQIQISEKHSKNSFENKVVVKASEETSDKIVGTNVASDGEVLDESEFAQKLIEETTPRPSYQKNKDKLIKAPLQSRSEPFKKSVINLENETKKPIMHEKDPRKKSALCKGDQWRSPLCSRYIPITSMDSLNAGFHGQSEFENFSTNNYASDLHKKSNYMPELTQRDPRIRNAVNHLTKATNLGIPPNGNNLSLYNVQKCGLNDPRTKIRHPPHHNNITNPISANDAHRHVSRRFPEPKSYAEYKRMKQIEKEKLQKKLQLNEETKNLFSGSTDNISNNQPSSGGMAQTFLFRNQSDVPSKTKAKKNRSKKNKTATSLPSFNTNNLLKKKKMKQSQTGKREAFGKSMGSGSQKSTQEESIDEGDTKRKDASDRRHSSDVEDSISPLEMLYSSEDIPKSGRGYGLQKFKIPKKMGSTGNHIKAKENKTVIKKNVPLERKKISLSKTNKITFFEESMENPNKKMSDISKIIVVEGTPGRTEIKEKTSSADIKIKSHKECAGREKFIETELSLKKREISICTNNSNNAQNVFEGFKKGGNSNDESLKNKESNQKEDGSPTDGVNAEIAVVAACSDSKKEQKSESLKTKETDIVKKGGELVSKDVCDPTNEDDDHEKTVKHSELKAENDKAVDSSSTAKCDRNADINVSVTGHDEAKELDTNSDKKGMVSKEEITQEFVEALIRKSFQTGEGKLLLAQAKLFEEFARKLNSKKLKTIQKIINSESDSSSSSEYFSEEEKQKKRSKKSEKALRIKKKKKKLKKIKKPKSSLSESDESSEEEEEEEEELEEKNNVEKEKKKEIEREKEKKKEIEREKETEPLKKEEQRERKGQSKLLENSNAPDGDRIPEGDSIKNSININKSGNGLAKSEMESGKKRRAINMRKCISKKKLNRKQGQKKLFEQILSETPRDGVGVVNSGPDSEEKESEQKIKPKPKGKGRTELDRLHDDIRSMFISSGVVTATGQRMCRILRESGGNMKNLDIVKESARMVEEEKLRRGLARRQSRISRTRKAMSSDNESRSGSRDKAPLRKRSRSRTQCEKVTESEDLHRSPVASAKNIKKLPCVLLNNLNMDSFVYGKKISEECISFSGIRSRNVAVRGRAWKGASHRCLSPRIPRIIDTHDGKNIFLARNLKKCKKAKSMRSKKVFHRKALMDIIKKLPLKMTKMKHLEICESKGGLNKGFQKKKTSPKQNKNSDKECSYMTNKNITLASLMDHAFDKKKVVYSCNLCMLTTRNITSHYKSAHPDSEVLISRLNKIEAQIAVHDSKENNYNITSLEHAHSLEMIRRRVKSKLKESVAYQCRMCNSAKISDIGTFYTHVSGHTGEYRFKCPSENCSMMTATKENMKFHILTKHSADRYDLYEKIIETCSIPVEWGNLYGYLCSKCNYVQMARENLEQHVQKYHSSDESVKIIKINMSANLSNETLSGSEPKKTKIGNTVSDVEFSDDEDNKLEDPVDAANLCKEGDEDSVIKTREIIKRKLPLKSHEVWIESQNGENDSNEKPTAKKPLLDSSITPGNDECLRGGGSTDQEFKSKRGNGLNNENRHETLRSCKNNSKATSVSKRIKPSKAPNDEDRTEKYTLSDIGESSKKNSSNPVRPKLRKLKVGPLEAQMLGQEVVLYECFVKGCLFSTKIFDLFEKHVKISHATLRWEGICDICWLKRGFVVHLTPNKLISAVQHLRLHETDDSPEGSNLIRKLKESSNVKIEEVFEKDGDKPIKCSNESAGVERPLLRVRNLVGDRLSTPKEIKDDSIEGNDDVVTGVDDSKIEISESETTSKGNGPAMFTIENVRSLNPQGNSEVDELHIEDLIPSVPDMETPREPHPIPTKPVIVRSCPSRKIVIGPNSNPISMEVGQLQVVKAASVTPVVLSPITNVTPIRVLSSVSSAASPTQFTVQPVMVSTPTPFLPSSNAVSVILPTAMSSSSQSIPPTVASRVEKSMQQKSGDEDDSNESQNTNFLESLLLSPDASAKSPSKRIRTKVYRSNNAGATLSKSEETDESTQSSVGLQKLSKSGVGSKTVKDSKIYREMLTKTKLCHLFKCMAIECSFTCNNENVFNQHIGLHEAQRRMKGQQRSWRIAYVDSKMRKVFHWHQCAYCCELLAFTSFALSRHILMEHGHCMYQCAYCFYRAISQTYVEIHQNTVHAHILKYNARVIYKCKQLFPGPSKNSALEKQGKRQNVRPYHCDQCGSKFYITQEFMNHLTTEHQSVTAYTCHICKNLCFKAERLIVHYKLHSYCTYQCAYCLHGTETEKEMMFHLCNFHFSYPAYIYVRALAENQSNVGTKRSTKKKKCVGSQIDSLKVITYESSTLNSDCIVEVDCDEESSTDDPSKVSESQDLSAIVAELGINAENGSTSGISPLIKELASIGGNSNESLSVKSLLPNAQFSSENENPSESCSFLISSGLNSGQDQSEDKDMSVPLGQLNLEVISVNKAQTLPSPCSAESTIPLVTDKNLKLNEIIVNLQNKDKSSMTSAMLNEVTDESKCEAPTQTKVNTAAIHKLPPVVLGRGSGSSNVSTITSLETLNKKYETSCNETIQSSGTQEENINCSASVSHSAAEVATRPDESGTATDDRAAESSLGPLITNVVSLSSGAFQKDDRRIDSETLPKISNVCSLYSESKAGATVPNDSSKIIVNIHSKTNSSSVLKPPIIRVEDFSIGEIIKQCLNEKNEESAKISSEFKEKEFKKSEDSVESPEIIIIEDCKKTENVLTVTIDSEDEKEPDPPDSCQKKIKDKEKLAPTNDVKIRKEMELLRDQIASETDCLLFDDAITESPLSNAPLSLKAAVAQRTEKKSESLLSPIEEAICSLHKILEEEGEKQKKESLDESSKSSEEFRPLPRTRSFTKEKAKTREGQENGEKRASDEGLGGSNGSGEGCVKKEKKFLEGLSGMKLYICGNEKCNYAAEDDLKLKDHLYVCDVSGESSLLVCPHCTKPIKQINSFTEHLKHHGEKKYFCGLCSFSSAVEASLIRHVKQKHKCCMVKSVPKEPPKEGYLVFYPKNHKLDKQDVETCVYFPGDEDKLPLQAVYQVNVNCGKCPYFTKVRSNMVRHLKIHLKSVETEGVVIVPSTAPTNPVPCLDTKEKMFDKMTNLAASSQLAQAKEKTAIEALTSEDEAKLPQFVAEQMRYKCCLPDCNYITVDDSMLKHHIKALHDEINYYSCPHCRNTVHVDVRNVTLDKIGYHLKLHDAKLYKCAHCIYFHYQKAVVEKHTLEKHPDRRYYVHTVREPKIESSTVEEQPIVESSPKVWKCGLCNEFQSFSKVCVLEHLARVHSTKSKYKCQMCDMKSNLYYAFYSHFASKHVGEKVSYIRTVVQVTSSASDCSPMNVETSNEYFDTTPLWQRGAPRVRHIRGILIEEEEIKTKKNKKFTEENDVETEMAEVAAPKNAFYCPLCSDKKTFYTKNADCFRSHLYQELNYQQFACTLCGKMFVDKKEYEKHHAKNHPDKSQALKQTKEDGEIMFWVDKVIAKQKEEIEKKKRRMSEEDSNDSQGSLKKKKKSD